jgi:hypothetical protein
MRYKLTVILDEVSSARVTDSAFWMIIYSMQVYPSSRHTADMLYNQLLPYLNYKPYSSTLADNYNSVADWNQLPVSGDVTQTRALVDACTVVMARRGVAVGVARLFTLLLRFQLCLMIFSDMHQANTKGCTPSLSQH